MELAGAIPVATNVLNTVMIAMDSGDAELFSSCFTDSGSCTIQIANKTHTGTEELRQLCMALSPKFEVCATGKATSASKPQMRV